MAEKILSSLNNLFFHPKRFFKSVEGDKNYSKAMFFYVKVVIITTIINFILTIVILAAQKQLTIPPILYNILISIINIGIAFLIPFILTAITHLGVLIFRGKQKYFNTYKAVAYTPAIVLIYSLLSTIIYVIVNFIHPITLADTSQMTAEAAVQIFQDKSFLSLMVFTTVLLFASLIHSLLIQVIGISKFQKMSKLRAFLSAVIIPLILFIVYIIILVWASSFIQA